MKRWLGLAIAGLFLCLPAWAAPTVINPQFLPHATSSTQGALELLGDFAGSGSAWNLPVVRGVQGVVWSSTAPSQGQLYRYNALTGQMVAVTLAELQPALVVATSNITLSGTQTIDGVSVGTSARVLAVGQSTASQNGLWIVQSGAWVRPDTYAAGQLVNPASYVVVTAGTVNLNSAWMITGTSSAITVDSTSTTWKCIVGPTGVTAGTYGDATHSAQVTIGADGRATSITSVAISGVPGSSFSNESFAISGTTYTVAHTAAGNLKTCFLDGLAVDPSKFTISGTTLTLDGSITLANYAAVQVTYSY